MGTFDNINDVLHVLEEQKLSYFLMVISTNKEKTDDISIFTSITQAEIGKVLKILAEYKKKSESEKEDDKD